MRRSSKFIRIRLYESSKTNTSQQLIKIRAFSKIAPIPAQFILLLVVY